MSNGADKANEALYRQHIEYMLDRIIKLLEEIRNRLPAD